MIYIDNLRHFRICKIELPDGDYLYNFYTENVKKSGYKPFLSVLAPDIDIGNEVYMTDQFTTGMMDHVRRMMITGDPNNIGAKFPPEFQLKNKTAIKAISQQYSRNIHQGDREFIEYLAGHASIRHSQYNSKVYDHVQEQVTAINTSRGWDISIAQNLYVFNTASEGTVYGNEITLLISAPLHGFMQPILKGKHYNLINGALVMVDPIPGALSYESAFSQYASVELAPWYENCGVMVKNMENHPFPDCTQNCNKICYVLVDTDGTPFHMTEFISDRKWSGELPVHAFGRAIEHSFRLEMNLECDMVLGHSLTDVVIPLTDETRKNYVKSNGKLFYLSDLPSWVQRRGDHAEFSI